MRIEWRGESWFGEPDESVGDRSDATYEWQRSRAEARGGTLIKNERHI